MRTPHSTVSIEPLESRALFNAAGFVDAITNPLLPYLPGASWVYKGTDDGQPEINRVVVQSYTKQIKGVTCTVVLDRVYLSGELVEKTQDFYAQDDRGNVWYFGESSREMHNGKVVSREGSWIAGEDGASAGIIMHAQPAPGSAAYFQEFQKDVAEDQAQDLTLHARASTYVAKYKNCLETLEFSNLEKGVSEAKFYAAGVGMVESRTLTGDETEILKLRSFTPGSVT